MRRLLFFLFAVAQLPLMAQRINLSGEWQLEMEGLPATRVKLPGTTDTNRKGHALRQKDETTHLSRLFSYKGKAYYTRDIVISKEWNKKPLMFFFERTKPSQLYIDDELVGSCNNISTPHRYRVQKGLKAGKHTIRLLVDNGSGVPEQVYASSHAYTEDTQTNWNGVIGEMYVEVLDKKTSKPLNSSRASNATSFSRMSSLSKASTSSRDSIGYRDVSNFPTLSIQGRHFYANGHPVFLRGKHDACVWPLTGHVPMDLKSWRQYLARCQDFGINHVRFHSWCPPEAAFVAADEMGIYLQPELPFWGNFDAKDSLLMTFLRNEGINILCEYGHHPSFAMFALGNELWGSIEKMHEFIEDFRKIAPHILYTFGSNFYLGYKGVQPGMDYFTTCRVGGEAWGSYDTHTRGSFSFADAKTGGMLNTERPNTMMTLDAGCLKSDIPVISHETGQFQTYPDYGEMLKYTGVLYPNNMQEFHSRLAEAGMADQAAAFHKASGLWSVRLYKADIELDLRTESMAGFQLLDLQDYPGQGSAYVGVLDAFMDSKGIVNEREWTQWCNDVVPLALMPSYTYTAGQQQEIEVKIANYGKESLKGKTLRWIVGNMEGEMAIPDGYGLLKVGKIPFEAPVTDRAAKLEMALVIDGTYYHNTYPLWVYPKHTEAHPEGKVVVTGVMTDSISQLLNDGARVLWIPDSTEFRDNTIGGLFQTDYWNYRMFKTICEKNKKPVSPGTLGILCDPKHPIFRQFPTEMHTNWQWYDVIKGSRPMILDNLIVSYRPIVQVIDNVERNHRLGLVFEFKVGKGGLLMFMSNKDNELYYSILDYMNSDKFNPTHEIQLTELLQALRDGLQEPDIEQLDNISQY